MFVEKLVINSVRNVESIELAPIAGCNLILGQNGSGKTSLLESIYLLGHGKSFRKGHTKDVLSHSAESLTVQVLANWQGQTKRFGLRKSASKSSEIRIDGESINKQSDLSSYFPIICFSPLSIELLDGAAATRRKFLDWLVFHVEHKNCVSLYKEHSRILEQRNRSLKKGDIQLAKSWDPQLIDLTNQISEFRQKAAESIEDLTKSYFDGLISNSFCRDKTLSIQLKKGWKQDSTFEGALSASLENDMRKRVTQVGCHRDDIKIDIDGEPAKLCLSRGESKVLVLAMMLAADQIIRQRTNKLPIWLIDDLAAELDSDALRNLLSHLYQLKSQVFITCVEKDLASVKQSIEFEYAMFHVKHGKLIN